MNVSQDLNKESVKGPTKKSAFGVRQLVLFGAFFLVLTAFLVDKYYLMPSAQAKIDLMQNELTASLNDDNRKQVHEKIGKPNSSFTYKGLEIEQYRFARGLPFYKKPMLDIAYRGDAIAFYSANAEEPITKEYIDSKDAKISEHPEGDRDLKAVGAGG